MRHMSIIVTSIRSNMAMSNGFRIGRIRRFIATLSVAFIRWTGPMGLNPIWRLVNALETHSAQYAKAIAPYGLRAIRGLEIVIVVLCYSLVSWLNNTVP